MSLPGNQIQFRFTQADAARALKRMRKFGFRSPKDQVITEFARVTIIVLPLIALAMQVISIEIYFAFVIGYFAVRVFDKRIKPALLNRFGPVELRPRMSEGEVVVTLEPAGVRTLSESSQGFISWAVINVSRVGDGFVLRVSHEMSIALPDAWLPKGWSVSEAKQAFRTWTGQDIA